MLVTAIASSIPAALACGTEERVVLFAEPGTYHETRNGKVFANFEATVFDPMLFVKQRSGGWLQVYVREYKRDLWVRASKADTTGGCSNSAQSGGHRLLGSDGVKPDD